MARIDRERCIGCAICAGICPEGIEMRDGKAAIKDQKAACLKDASESCPQGAILLDDKGSSGPGSNPDRVYNQGGWGRGSGQGRGMGSGRGRGLGRGPRDGRGRGMGGGGRGW